MMVDWALTQKGWRAPLIKMAFLTALWLVIAFVFATEIYLMARGGPINISWGMAADGALHDWCPWILLSPVVIFLAEKFTFRRGRWRRSLIVHLAASLLLAVAYEGILLVLFPAPLLVTTGSLGGSVGFFSTVGGHPGGGFGLHVAGISTLALPPPISGQSNAVLIDQGRIVRFESGGVAGSTNSRVVIGGRLNAPGALDSITGHVAGWGQVPPPPSRSAQILRLAIPPLQFTFPIYFCIVCGCWVFGHFQEVREHERKTLELEARLTQANLQTLKMQLQPHFLFNTLNAIASLVYEEPKVADDMIGSLSQFLRTTLEVSSENEIPLRRELEFVDRYLEIQRARFGPRLRLNRDISRDVTQALVPPLILQPLVENAIRHGIEGREAGGTLTIRAIRNGSELCLEISDDGDGFSGSQLLKAGNGVGLSNTKARLQALYGAQHEFKLTANQPCGATVRIRVPLRFASTNPDPAHEYSYVHSG